MFTKEDVQVELREFMHGFACSVERMYGPNSGGGLLGHPGISAHALDPAEARIENSWLWRTVLEMYDYGIHGILFPNDRVDVVDGSLADVELFFQALGGDGMELYLEEDDVRWPKLSIRTVRTAIARIVLDGGSRYSPSEGEHVPSRYLTIGEVALLAGMDERSVRNAANPKLADGLVTKNFGRRSLVDIHDARRWLAGRKAFVPTHGFVPPPAPPEPDLTQLVLPYDVQSRLEYFAGQASIPSSELLTKLLDIHERTLGDTKEQP